MRFWSVLLAVFVAAGSAGQTADSARREAILPPVLEWNGKSRALVVPVSDPWVTPAERSGLTRTPSYDDTVGYLKRLEAASSQLRMISLGKSPEGRDLWMVVASKEGAFTPEALKATGKPTLFAQAGIHSGEIDGKDAGLMLLRDMTVGGTKKRLLDRANLLFVPIFSVDGHERFSPYGRINQRGPAETGWRTTSQNLNLNRDYAKLDAPEMRALVRAIDAWDPDLYLDLHVTDGMDHQYDVTYSFNGSHGWSPSIGRWLERTLVPAWTADLTAMGHTPGAYPQLLDERDPEKGIVDVIAGLRYSEGFGDARHLPTVLIETHSLKTYDRRVLGTYVLLESSLSALGAQAAALRGAIAEDRARRPARIPLVWALRPGPEKVPFRGIESRVRDSPITGSTAIEWTGRPVDTTVLLFRADVPTDWADRPRAYWIPPSLTEVISRLEAQGIRMERQSQPREIDVTMDRLSHVQLAEAPFEGRVSVTAKTSTERRRERFPAGSVRVPTDQPLGDLAALLLEPRSPDSFFQWGFLLGPLQQAEYAEPYVIEPMATRMLAESPELARLFADRLAGDPAFAADPAARLEWFYRRTPFFDDRWNLYPIGRE